MSNIELPSEYDIGVQPEPPKKEEKPVGNGLMRPEDIVDAADSDDLLSILLENNLDMIDEKSRRQHAKVRANMENHRLRSLYYDKAKKAYQKQWNKCHEQGGHKFATIEVRGYNVSSCDICGFARVPDHTNSYDWEYSSSRAKDMNRALVDTLSKRMIEVDEKAGLFEPVTPEEFMHEEVPPPPPEKKKKVRRSIPWFPWWRWNGAKIRHEFQPLRIPLPLWKEV